MDPSCSRNSFDIYEGTKKVLNENKTEINVDMVDRSTETGINGEEQIDDIEREDFEEENRIIKECSRLIVDDKISATPFLGPLSSGNSSLASSSETISTLSNVVNDYNIPGCSKQTCKDLISYTNNVIQCTKYDELSGDNTPTKPDFMQKLLNSCTEEKKEFPKGKLYKADAEALCTIEGDVRELDAVNGSSDRTNSNASSIASTSSQNKDFNLQSTTNAERLLGLNDTVKSESGFIKSSGYMQNNCEGYEDSDEEVAEEICTCLSSHEDDDDDDDIDTEQQRLLRKRCFDDTPLASVKRFCSEIASTSSGPDCNWASTLQNGSPLQALGPNDIAQASPELKSWLNKFQLWTNTDKIEAIDGLIKCCAASQIRHMMNAIEPLFQRDFISLLPKELALTVLGYLEPKDLLRAARTCRYWRFLADDNLLWKEQCRRIGISTLKNMPHTLPRCLNPWKIAYMIQYMIDNNWLHKPVNKPTVMKGHDDHVITCLQFYGKRILSGSDDTTLKVWSAVSGKCIRTLIGHSGGVWSSQMIGNTVISGSTDRTLRVWDVKTGRCLKVLSGHTSTVRCMHMYRHKNVFRVVSGSRDATLRIWSIPDGQCLRVLIGHLAAVRCVQYNGKVVVSGAYDYFVKVWNPDTGECLHTLAGHTNRVYSLQFDGVHVVSGSLDTTIRVWDVRSGQLKHTLTGHQSLTSGMELHSNILVSGNADSTVKVWDITTGQCLHTLSGPNKHQSAVTCLQSTKRFVITSSDDGTVKLWNVRTGEFIRNLVELSSGGSGGVVWRIRASATKLICAVGSRNGTEETKLLVLNFDKPNACRKCAQ